jgi:ribosomal protein S18 acetylase RimI-like enzyme
MGLTLVEMDRDDFARRRRELVAGYATAIAAPRGLSVPEAEAEAERDVAEKAPRGPATPGELMRKAVVGAAEVGWIWVSLPGPAMPGMAWISNVEVDPGHRSRGYGRAIIEAIEAELKALGVPRLGLNVFADNAAACRLYERLGFEVTAQQRSRSLVDVPAAHTDLAHHHRDRLAAPADSSEGIALVPMIDYAARIEALLADFAQTLVQDQGLWHGEAEAQAARKLTELLPRGADTEGAILRTAVADGTPVGWVWAAMPAPPRPGMGWLHHIDIDEAYRSRGYGRAVIAAVEAELVRRGVRRMGLSVPGYHVEARRLCVRLGYELQSQQMVKAL